MFTRNSMSKPAQFSFSADLFMLQAIMRSEAQKSKFQELAYRFPHNCYKQVIEWLLNNSEQFGLESFNGVSIKRTAREVEVTFPNEDEENKMHLFFSHFNEKRKQAQGVDPSFPPMPNIYQGQSKPIKDVVERYIIFINNAFDGDINSVPVPTGDDGEDFIYHCS